MNLVFDKLVVRVKVNLRVLPQPDVMDLLPLFHSTPLISKSKDKNELHVFNGSVISKVDLYCSFCQTGVNCAFLGNYL